MSTVYTVYETSKASRSFSDLNSLILAANHTPAESAAQAVKIITIYLHNSYGNWLYPDQQTHRYIRVVVDIPRGRLQGAEEKQPFMRRIIEACMKYEGKKADECEVEVRINEFDASDYMKVGGTKGTARPQAAGGTQKLRKNLQKQPNSPRRMTQGWTEGMGAPELEFDAPRINFDQVRL